MADQVLSEVRNADWQFEAKRTYVLAAEIFDQKLSDGEYRLLTLLRLRASGGDNNYVSHATLAKDLRIHEKTVAKRMGKLKKLGYITCRSRGFAKSNIKTITSMVERYDKEILLAERKELLGMDRSQEFLDRLHNIDNASDDRSSDSATNGDLDSADDLHRERNDSLIGNGNAPSIGSENATQNRLRELDESEIDSLKVGDQPSAEPQSPSPVGIGFSGGEAYDLSTGEILKNQGELRDLGPESTNKPKGEIHAAPESGSLADADGDSRRAAAASVIAAAGVRADRKGKEALAKRRAKKAAREASGEAERVREQKRATKKERQTIKSQLEEFMRDVYGDRFPDAKMGRFSGKEYGNLNHLLQIYEGDLVLIKKAWKFLCEEWDETKRKLKIDSAVPTIGLFVGFRESIFGMVQETTTSRQEMENQSLSDQFDW